MFKEQRVAPREPLQLPLKLEHGIAAVTRDISASGMYFEVEGSHQLTGPVVFEMYIAEARMKFTAEGEIVRLEHKPGSTGIAVRLIGPRLETLK